MFAYWQPYVILCGMFLTIYFQIRWLNSGLKTFESLFIVPVFQSFWILISVVAGMIFFGEYKHVFNEPNSSIFFPIGVIITIAGVYVLSQRGGGGGAKEASARNTPQQRNYKHFAQSKGDAAWVDIRASAQLDFSGGDGGYQSPSQSDDFLLSEDDPLFYASPAPPIGFMSGPFIDTRYATSAPHSWHASSYIDAEDLEPLHDEEYGAMIDDDASDRHGGRLVPPPMSSSAPPRMHHQHAATWRECDAIHEADIVEDGMHASSAAGAPAKPRDNNPTKTTQKERKTGGR
jgi:hypothetical protein